MTYAIQVEIICDICQKRFVGGVENIPNRAGITKGTPMTAVRREAAAKGWARIKLPSTFISDGIPRRAMTLDCCPACRDGAASSIAHLRQVPLWFEEA